MNNLKNSLYYFGIAMIFVYVALAMILFFSDYESSLKQPNRTILAIIILLYAAFKTYRIFANKRSKALDEDK